jgi:hypothetical protein
MKRNRVWVVEWLDDSGERPGNWRPGNDAERLRAVEKAAKAMVEYADRCNDDSTELENLRGAFSGRGPEGKVKT